MSAFSVFLFVVSVVSCGVAYAEDLEFSFDIFLLLGRLEGSGNLIKTNLCFILLLIWRHLRSSVLLS